MPDWIGFRCDNNLCGRLTQGSPYTLYEPHPEVEMREGVLYPLDAEEPRSLTFCSKDCLAAWAVDNPNDSSRGQGEVQKYDAAQAARVAHEGWPGA